jgi:hypothetical protein
MNSSKFLFFITFFLVVNFNIGFGSSERCMLTQLFGEITRRKLFYDIIPFVSYNLFGLYSIYGFFAGMKKCLSKNKKWHILKRIYNYVCDTAKTRTFIGLFKPAAAAYSIIWVHLITRYYIFNDKNTFNICCHRI